MERYKTILDKNDNKSGSRFKILIYDIILFIALAIFMLTGFLYV